MKIYSKKELDDIWLTLLATRNPDYNTWYSFVEAYKSAPDDYRDGDL
jgi:hypothetical protein